MARQSITINKPNDDWLKSEVEKEEYASKSELINELVRQARERQAKRDEIRMKLEQGEKSGFTHRSAEEILAESKKRLEKNK